MTITYKQANGRAKREENIMAEKVYPAMYPVYEISVRWIQNGDHDPKYPNWYKGLRKGRVRNCTGFTKMYKEKDKTLEEVWIDTKRWWRKYKKDKLKDKAPTRPLIKIKFTGLESWCLEWFCHWTFDTGQTDAEVLDSFYRFVQRKEALNLKNGHTRHERIDGEIRPFYVLMGAEDRWRWSGKDDEGGIIEPPCRCKHCKKLGFIRIGH